VINTNRPSTIRLKSREDNESPYLKPHTIANFDDGALPENL
jgi:hypothetical protein